MKTAVVIVLCVLAVVLIVAVVGFCLLLDLLEERRVDDAARRGAEGPRSGERDRQERPEEK
ncbi:hypothetical protein [Streptomyces rhizosphaerihabitans]|uniref:hypothetical protein n=1 Tax=Streptomyces rhizosphaerihabitans TaxID=1266770 RepID=UPI0021C1D55B|nr:hypothetical protein [Streptomyces rhizosphaerihabitans]MCT9006867.1 hypothetical protein [Streptomyces rhizosphaerihabitans]